MKTGSKTALAAGKKAAATRRRNKALKAAMPATSKVRGIVAKKVIFKEINESKFHKLVIDTPVSLYVHKKMGYMYITPDLTHVKK